MPRSREISQPLGDQSPEVYQWKGTLRATSPAGGEGVPRPKSPERSRTPTSTRSAFTSTGVYMTEVPKGSSLRRSSSNGNLRKSSDNIAAKFNMSGSGGSTGGKAIRTSVELNNIEGEYIKNLQQQVYFLELEASYLREQARKATDMHPVMTSEAERMLNKLRKMQTEVDGLSLEVQRKDSNIGLLSSEKSKIMERLQTNEGNHTRERRLLMEEVMQLKKNKDALERENVRKDTQLLQARDELSKSITAVKNAEQRIQLLRNQLDDRIEQHKLTQLGLEEKRAELLHTESRLREIEEKYYNSSVIMADKANQDLREEVRMLRQKIKETEMTADQDRYLRNKITDDSSHLVKENAILNQQVLELRKQVDRERDMREGQDNRRSHNYAELLATKDMEKQLQIEVNQLKDLYQTEKERANHYMEQLKKQELDSTSKDLNASTLRSRVTEVESLRQSAEIDNSQLRKDKMLLVDHVADLQSQLEAKEMELIRYRAQLGNVESRMSDIERSKTMESLAHSQRWEEFEKLADSMKSLSHSMAYSSSPRTHSKIAY